MFIVIRRYFCITDTQGQNKVMCTFKNKYVSNTHQDFLCPKC
jgi:hypothetical protein